MRWIIALLVGVLLGGAVVVALSSSDAPSPSKTDPQRSSGSGGAAGMALTPVRSLITAEMGASTIEYLISNADSVKHTYTVEALELSEVGAALPDGPGNATSWVRFDRRQYVAGPRGSVRAKVRITPPANRGAEERRVGVAFTDTTPSLAGGTGAAMRARIVTSVYVQGSGPVVRDARLSGLDLPFLAFGKFDVTARIVNDGTVSVVPGTAANRVAATMTGDEFTSLNGNIVRPATSGEVIGTVVDHPLACWCQVRVTLFEGDEAVSVVTGRVLIAPWWMLAAVGLAALGLVLVAAQGILRRRGQAVAPA